MSKQMNLLSEEQGTPLFSQPTYNQLVHAQTEADWQDCLRLAREEHEQQPGYGILRRIVDAERQQQTTQL